MHISTAIFAYMKKDEETLQAYFWKNVDTMLFLQSKTLLLMSEALGIKYPTLMSWRARKRLPDLISASSIAGYLGTTTEALLSESPSDKSNITERLSKAFSNMPPKIQVENSEVMKELQDIFKILERITVAWEEKTK